MDLNQWMATHPLLWPAIFLLCFSLWWLTICYFVGFLTGWHRLARQFRHREEFSGRKWRWRSGRMRYGSHYGNILTLGSDGDGLYLSVAWLFSAGSPPLFIPWRETEVRQRKFFLLFDQTGFILGREAQIPLWISRRLAQEILSYRPAASIGTPYVISSAPIE